MAFSPTVSSVHAVLFGAMAPKRPPAHANAKSWKPVKKETCTKLRKEPLDKRLLQTPAVDCGTCHQSSHDLDRDYQPTQKYIVWKDKRQNAEGLWCPQGTQCQLCFGTMRRYTSLNKAELEEKLNDGAFNEKFMARRKDRAQGTELFTDEARGDIQHEIEEAEEEFSEDGEEGAFYELYNFKRKENPRFPHGGALDCSHNGEVWAQVGDSEKR